MWAAFLLAACDPPKDETVLESPIVASGAVRSPGAPPAIDDWFAGGDTREFQAGLRRSDPELIDHLPQVLETWAPWGELAELPYELDPLIRYPKPTCDQLLSVIRTQPDAQGLWAGCGSPEAQQIAEAELSIEWLSYWYLYNARMDIRSPRIEAAIKTQPSANDVWAIAGLDPVVAVPALLDLASTVRDPGLQVHVLDALGTFDDPSAQVVCKAQRDTCFPYRGSIRWLALGHPVTTIPWAKAHPERNLELVNRVDQCVGDYLAYIEPRADGCFENLAALDWEAARRREPTLALTEVARQTPQMFSALKRFPSAAALNQHWVAIGLLDEPTDQVSAENALFQRGRSAWPYDDNQQLDPGRLAALSPELSTTRLLRREVGDQIVIEAWREGHRWRVQGSLQEEVWLAIGLLNHLAAEAKLSERFALTNSGTVVYATESGLLTADAEQLLFLQRRATTPVTEPLP